MRHDADAVGEESLASAVIDVDSIRLENAVDVLDIAGSDPAHTEVFDDKVCHHLDGRDDVLIARPLLPVIHHLLYEGPALLVVLFEEQESDDGDAGVEAVVHGLGIESTLPEYLTFLLMVRMVLTVLRTERPLTVRTVSITMEVPETAETDGFDLGSDHESGILDHELPGLDVPGGCQDAADVLTVGDLPGGQECRCRHLSGRISTDCIV